MQTNVNVILLFPTVLESSLNLDIKRALVNLTLSEKIGSKLCIHLYNRISMLKPSFTAARHVG